MLVELAVHDLGVISHANLVLGPGMTALTGETGAGKTLVVQAVQLLMGGRADPGMVRAGAVEAVVEGRFVRGRWQRACATPRDPSSRSQPCLRGWRHGVGGRACRVRGRAR